MMSDPSEASEPPPLGGEERRRHPRAQIELQVELRFDSVQHFLSASAEDISESGMFIRGWEATADGTPHEVGQRSRYGSTPVSSASSKGRPASSAGCGRPTAARRASAFSSSSSMRRAGG